MHDRGALLEAQHRLVLPDLEGVTQQQPVIAAWRLQGLDVTSMDTRGNKESSVAILQISDQLPHSHAIFGIRFSLVDQVKHMDKCQMSTIP